MDFGTLSPEINSCRMYAGPGSGSMLSAAAAWDRLAQALYDAATSYQSMTSGLTDGWQGAAATVMSQTAAPYIRWLNAAAAQAERTAIQARAAADAYESAFAATVSPQAIAANRALRTSLVATNSLGQSTPAIAAAEADYEKMWVQDAAAMYAYADASAAAATMTPFTSPPAAGELAPQGAVAAEASGTPTVDQEIVSSGTQLISTLPQALKRLSSASSKRFNTILLSMSSSLSKLSVLRLGFAKDASVPLAVAITGAAKSVSANRAAATAGFGRGMSIGTLSVPQTWPSAPKASAVSTEFHSAAAAIGRWASGESMFSTTTHTAVVRQR
ncbi:MAG TPA: PPE family protein [Mycobacterium sp.]|nr:PPE family protein [Mycobacterium sp.]